MMCMNMVYICIYSILIVHIKLMDILSVYHILSLTGDPQYIFERSDCNAFFNIKMYPPIYKYNSRMGCACMSFHLSVYITVSLSGCQRHVLTIRACGP